MLKQIYEVYEIFANIDMLEKRKIVCRNVKKLRKQRYDEFKKLYGKLGTENTYSAESIAAFLGLKSVKYYQRLESENDKCKYFSSDNLYKLAELFDVTIDEFYKDYEEK